MSINKARLRQLHSMLAPIMVLPILLTLITGLFYQMADVADKEADFFWLLELHKGNFGPLNLEVIYPFLNALGLFTLAITGITLWFQTPRRHLRS
ncbi:PepSY domain-containing protein [Microcoleus sp. FACHB-672]|uniref:PepSY domain-containing protein n=1 Tax=Microcoleus sp. FACHB-672 TaxID=2692825 RepID=UPI0016827663|nr:PepSY domain-containing protein [Microcoleus sp. FACHB-672]MBD2039433.1 PepSY domain-containing protein [Microcoleus sp. FACHB-672]